MQQPNLLTVAAFAATLGVTPACIRRWVLERKITVIKVGRLTRIPATEVNRIIAEGTRRAKGA